jgi:hypothetical protein
MKKICKRQVLLKLANRKGVWFHIVGLACLIWFAIRVLPAPHRSQYPCQQVAIPIAFGYLAFWSGLFYGLSRWVRNATLKTSKLIPTLIVGFVIAFTVSGMVFAGTYLPSNTSYGPWEPLANNPLGTPRGVNPGRVVWVWNPEATPSDLKGYWWKQENNNQEVINTMVSKGIQALAGVDDDAEAWTMLFTYFNEVHGNGAIGYQPGETIALKINLNNCWDWLINSYYKQDNERDASPYVVKALLHQLIDVVGVSEEDIIVYDASRCIGNWFYHRTYYESYPAFPLTPEFPEVHFVDAEGGALGREQVEPSNELIYFADGTGLTRTLPTCVTEATYLINMPLLKRHPIQTGVTLSGKNFFGTFIEPVVDLHPYHEASFIPGNPAPQVDLLAHQEIGGKTLLYLGDGLFGTKEDHRTIAHFTMYPFNDDWTNSLFFSQDPVALDSVMYDFLHAEGTNPCEGSQNYLHEAAVPPENVYDPEQDGIYVSESLGVHEHWNTEVDIFSSERYVGPAGNGIDFVALGEEHAAPAIVFTNPLEHRLYLFGEEKRTLPLTLIIGDIEVAAQVNGLTVDISKVEFYLDGTLKKTVTEAPYTWCWETPAFFRHILTVCAYYEERDPLKNDLLVWKFL